MERWDGYFLGICNAVAENSRCLSRKIGAIIVRDKSIISTGYNGPPRGVPHCGERHKHDDTLRWKLDKVSDDAKWFNTLDKCPRQLLGYKSGQGLEWCIAGHAERNAIVNAAREGISTKGAKIYMNCTTPCVPCLVEIINAGIEEIIHTGFSIYEENESTAMYLIEKSYIKMRGYIDG